MPRTIEVRTITGLDGKPYKLPKFDEDGVIVWKREPKEAGDQGEPEMADADTVTMLRWLVARIPVSAQRPNDDLRAHQLFNAVEHVVDGKLALKEKLYDWLHRALVREVPESKDRATDTKVPAMTCARALLGLSARTVVNQLKDQDEREDLLEVEPDSG